MNLKEIKKELKNFWNWLWNSESILSYISFIIIIIILIKLIIMPLLILVTGTSLPLAIVESCSMYHEGNFFTDFNDWWDYNEAKYQKYNITRQDFESYNFKRGFNKGDILFMTKANPETLKVGDIIIFSAAGKPIIHRIMEIKESEGKKIFSTMGDHNMGQLSVEKEISEQQLIAKASIRAVPYLGWIKLIFFEPSQPQNNKGFCDNNF